jgi:uncharacterized protein YuzE
MPIHLIGLKEYWFYEYCNKSNTNNKEINHLLNQIQSIFKDKLQSGAVQRFIEFGDYLFIDYNKSKHIIGFGIVIDHKRLNYDIQSDHYNGIHGFMEVVYLWGSVKQIFKVICCFTRDVLFRKYVVLNLLEDVMDKDGWEFDDIQLVSKKLKSKTIHRYRLLPKSLKTKQPDVPFDLHSINLSEMVE